MIKQRRLRERTILTLIPMAMIVLGASPGRPLQIGRLSSASLARRARGAVARGVSGAGGVFHHRRTENKIRHVVHSDNFTEESIARRAGGARARSDVMRGPWLENDVNSFHASLYGGAAVASAQRPLGLRQRTRMIKRGIMELAVRSVQFRNKFQWRPDRSNSFVDMNRSKLNNSRNDAIAVSDAANRSGKRISLRPLLSFFDRSRKITMETMDTMISMETMDTMISMETMDTMDVMGGDMNEVEYSKAMTVLSPSDIEIRADTSRATKVRVDKSTRGKWNPFRINLFKEKAIESAAMSSRGGAIATIVKSSASSQASIRTSTSTASISSTKSSSSSQTTSTILSTDTWVIETPLFPVILPKSWEPPTAIQSTAVQESITTTEVMEISVVIEQTEIVSKPSLQTLETATQPLIPKSAWASFQGNEFYYPESMELLAQTGLRMAVGNVEMVDWTGEKKTLKFLQDHGSSIASLTEALTSSQEILAWSGKFTADGQGSELPVIKTMAVIDKSPQCLAELLMDSSKVKVYNKMSLGRSDEEVFQSGM
jgi:hypothetical protein